MAKAKSKFEERCEQVGGVVLDEIERRAKGEEPKSKETIQGLSESLRAIGSVMGSGLIAVDSLPITDPKK